MPNAPTNQAQKFEREKPRAVAQPPPPFPRLPEKFISRYDKDIRDALNLYSDQCEDWVRKYVTGQS